MTKKIILGWLLSSLVSGMLAGTVQAQSSGTWLQTGAGPFDWGTSGNWIGGTIADGADNTATFSSSLTADQVVNLDGNRTIGNITNSSSGYDRAISGANTLTLDRTSGFPTIDVASSRTLIISNSIAGNDGLRKTGAGTLTLAGTNSFSGGVFINGGTLNLLSGATAANLGDPGNLVTFTGNGTNNFTSNTTLSQGFAVNAGVTATLGVNNQTITINNSLAGSGTLEVRSGSDPGGSCTFTGTSNTFSGDILCYNTSNGEYGGTLSMNSLDDTSGSRIKMGRGTGVFTYGNGAVVPLVLSNRQIELVSGGHGALNNNATNVNCTVTVNTDLLVSGTGTRNFTLGGSNTGKNKFVGVIPNGTGSTISLVKNGAGMWISSVNNTYGGSTTVNGGTLVLSGTNTYTGGTSISGATLVIGSIANYGVNCSIGAASSGAIVIGNHDYDGFLVYRGGAAACDRTVQVGNNTQGYDGGSIILNNGTGDLTFTANPFNTTYANAGSNTRWLTLGGTSGGTITGVLQDHSPMLLGFAKRGSGTWTLQGDNTFTGASSAAGGGNLVLDYTTNTGSKLADGASLTLGGSTLGGSTITLKGGSGLTEVVASTTLSVGASRITRDTGNTVLQMNSITRQAGANILFLDGTVVTTDTLNTNGILGGWATIGNDWAINSSGADGAITALSSYTGALPSSGTGSTTANYTLSGGQTQTDSSTLAAFTLKIAGSGVTDNTLALGASKLNITITSSSVLGGLLYVGGGTGFYNITADAGKGIDTSTTSDLIINTVTGTLNISAKINTSDSTRSLLKAGAGTLVLGATNAYTGSTYVNEGALRLANNTAAGTTAGGIQVQNGAALELSSNITVGAEALALDGNGISSGGALRNVSGNNTYGGVITIGGGGARINSDSGTLTLTNSITMTSLQTLTLGGAGDITVSNSVLTFGGPVVKDGTGTLGLVVSDSSASIIFDDLAINSGALEFKFTVAPSTNVPAIKVLGDLTFGGTAVISVTVDRSLVQQGELYPLLTVLGNAPTTVPLLDGYGRGLLWGGTDNRTLYLNSDAKGTILIIR